MDESYGDEYIDKQLFFIVNRSCFIKISCIVKLSCEMVKISE